jgi:hypothetical protein
MIFCKQIGLDYPKVLLSLMTKQGWGRPIELFLKDHNGQMQPVILN